MSDVDKARWLSCILEGFSGIRYVYDLVHHKNVYVNDRWIVDFGYSLEEVQTPGEFLASIVHPEDLSAVAAHHEALRSMGSDEVRRLRYRVRRKSGEFRWLESEDRPFSRNPDGSVHEILGFAHDVTAAVTLEKLNQESEERFRAIVETLPDAVFIGEPSGKFIEVNSAACRQLGYAKAELLALDLTDIIAPEYRDRARGRVGSHEPSGYMESEHLTKAGERVPVEVCVVPLRFGGKSVFLGVARETRERKVLEARVREAERLEAVGRLAGSVAHDFNNLLSVISGGAQLLVEDGQLNPEASSTAADILRASERGAELTAQLLTFSRRRRTEMAPLDLGAHVATTLKLVRRLLGEGITIDSRLEGRVIVCADKGMLDQALINLLVNARDALGGHGTVHIRVSSSDGRAWLVVGDDGQGMSEEVRCRVFEPFFTTKAEGRGTGLGLAAVHGIVHQHRGNIEVESRAGHGATFTISLPLESERKPSELPSESTKVSKAKRVLVVDDQPLVLKMVANMVEHLGHQVLRAGSPEEARTILEREGDPMDVLLTDVSLGAGASGPGLAKELVVKRPHLRVIYMSGLDHVLDRGDLVEGRDFLQKPPSLDDLRAALSRIDA